jgi:hypothetical protein
MVMSRGAARKRIVTHRRSDKVGTNLHNGLNMLQSADRETVVRRLVQAVGFEEARKLTVVIWDDQKGYGWPPKAK